MSAPSVNILTEKSDNFFIFYFHSSGEEYIRFFIQSLVHSMPLLYAPLYGSCTEFRWEQSTHHFPALNTFRIIPKGSIRFSQI